jgi:hypothetical protein
MALGTKTTLRFIRYKLFVVKNTVWYDTQRICWSFLAVRVRSRFLYPTAIALWPFGSSTTQVITHPSFIQEASGISQIRYSPMHCLSSIPPLPTVTKAYIKLCRPTKHLLLRLLSYRLSFNTSSTSTIQI